MHIDPSRVGQVFTDLAADWDTKNSRREVANGLSNALRIELARLIGDDCRVLDVGSGTGKVYEHIRESIGNSSAQVDMIDLSPAMCEMAEKKTVGDGRAQVYCGDVTSAELGEEYDLVTLLQVLHHVSDPGEVLRSTGSLLSDRGRIVALCLGPHYHRELFDFDENNPHDAIGRRTEARWREAFLQAGLKPERIIEDYFEISYPDLDSFQEFAHSVGMRQKIDGYEPTAVSDPWSDLARTQPPGVEEAPVSVTGHHYTFVFRPAAA